MPKSKVVVQNSSNKLKSRLVLATQLVSNIDDYSTIKDKNGVFGSKATIKSGGVTLNSAELDFEFTIPFDDNLEIDEGEIIVYNLSNATIRELKMKQSLSVEAGYEGDTGVIFNGYITKVSTKREGADKVTTIKIIDSLTRDKATYEDKTFSGQTAKQILEALLKETGLPIAHKNIKDDYTYDKDVTVDGSIVSEIKKQSEVCNVSTFLRGGKIYCCSLNDFTEVNFVVSEETGMIGSPEYYSEEVTIEDETRTIEGLDIEMILQHRMGAGAVVQLTSKEYKGKYRVRSGTHTFNNSEAITKIRVV